LATLAIADIAAGSGRYSLPLAQQAQHVLLIDWSAKMLAAAQTWLDSQQLSNVTYQQADWHQLPATPIADLLFVSQLPTLTAADLPALERLGTQAVAINTQIAFENQRQQQAAAFFDWPIPQTYQAKPTRAKAYRDFLNTKQRAWQHTEFTYHQEQLTTPTEVLQDFDRPFSLQQATDLAHFLGVDNAQAPLPTTLTYCFQVLTWSVPH
jgi:16S rRNA G966 N2-methylase RsmD